MFCIDTCKMNEMKNNKVYKKPENGSWEEVKEQLKAKFTWLKESDLIFEEGEKDNMMDRIQIKLGKTKEELRQIMAGLQNQAQV